MIGIYKITSPKGRVYIGQSSDIKRRFKEYRGVRNCKAQTKLYRSFIKYGVLNHTFEILKECEKIDLNRLERYYQDFYDVINGGLNCMLQEVDDLPRVITDETRRKIGESSSKRNKGKGNPMYGVRLTGDKNPMFGRERPHSELTKIVLAFKHTKLILDTFTGIYYYGVRDLYNIIGIDRRKINKWLISNNTRYILA